MYQMMALSIFTVRGQHVITLEHGGDIMNGTVEWNLRSKENLDISYGVYFSSWNLKRLNHNLENLR